MSRQERGFYLISGAVLGGLLAALWASAASSALLLGSGWHAISLFDLLKAGVELPSHLADPRGAFPPRQAAAMPGALGFYLLAIPLCSALTYAALWGWRAVQSLDLPTGVSGQRRAPSARWAKRSELKALRVGAPEPGRLTLGRSGRGLLAAEERRSVIVIAPTQSMKTTGFAIPALLEWQGPVLATSVKSDLLDDTLARREQLGRVMVFDPAQVTQVPRTQATPLAGAGTYHGAKRVASWLASGAQSAGAGGLKDADFWFTTAEKLLAPLLFSAASSGGRMAEVVRWLDEGPASEEEVVKLLDKTEDEAALRAYQATQNREERQRSSVYTTAEMTVAAFADPKVLEETEHPEYTPASLLDGGAHTLYLCAPRSEQHRLRPVFSMLVQELLVVIEEIVHTTRKPLDPPLLLLLDEAANIAPIPDLDEIASTGAGQGVQLLTVFHDLAQMRVRLGERALTALNNHTAKVFGSGIADPETHRYVSDIVGAGTFEQRSETAGERGRRSETEGETHRALIDPSVLRGADPRTALLVYKHLSPAMIDLRLSYEDPELIELRAGSLGRERAGRRAP